MLNLLESTRNTMLDAVLAALAAGAAPARLKILSIPRPATPGTAIAPGDVLADFELADPAAPAASGGIVEFTQVADVSALATGTALSARLEDGDGNGVLDVDVITSGTPDGTQILVSVDPIEAGKPVQITGLTIAL